MESILFNHRPGYVYFLVPTFNPGINIGTFFLYSIYSFPSRFSSSGSSIAFNSHAFSRTKRGVKMKVRVIDLNKMLNPNSAIDIPVTIGFLT